MHWLKTSIHALRRPRRARMAVAGLLLAAAGSTVGALAQQQQGDFTDSPFLRVDPQRVVLSARDARVPCGECHESEYEVWRETKHATGFDTMHRTESAQDILENMGLTVTKRQESLCMRCHYTVGPQLRAIAGVSCESCHGPARDWVDVHNKWGEGITHPDQEAPDHRQQRIQESSAGGMLRPSGNLYAVAANCFECHTVPIEELVNRGGHVSGSSRFELVERTDAIRHNFVAQQWDTEAGNREPDPDRIRLMFAVGRVLAYEYALRGLANATTEDRYFKAMERRAQQSYRALDAMARSIESPAIAEILEAGTDLRLVPGNGDALLAAAEQIRTAGQRFASSADGALLAGLDPLISGAPPVAAEPAIAPAPDSTSAPPAGDTVSAVPPSAAPTATSEPQPPPVETAPAAPTLPGRILNRPGWFPPVDGRYRVIIPGCDCHSDAEDWWFDDTHEATAVRLLDRTPRATEIATLYGIGPDQMTRGDRLCMNCHGTALSDAPSAEVLTGVSCEKCHGPSSEFLEPHEDGGNPQLGMIALKQADVQARTCAGCHRISDERLLAAGHPSGEQYDIVAANRTILHWPDRRPERERAKRAESYTPTPDAALRTAFQQVAASRPIPQVTVVAPPPAADPAPRTVPATRPTRRPSPGEVRAAGEPPTPSSPPRPPATRLPRPTSAGPVTLDLDALPARPDTLTSEQLLLLVKLRLERLYGSLGRR